MKYIVVTGGVISGLGKGITASSIGMILKQAGKCVTMIKIDPYINVDAGTMSPFEHGETFVLNDGAETDLDLGNYERFLDITLTRQHNITTGKVYKSVIEKERRGDYLGETVQIIPHITNEIQTFISDAANVCVDGDKTPEICIIELGGTVGDIESMPFIESLRQARFDNDDFDMCFLHVSLVPKIGTNGELKTKPTQNSVKDLRELGITPDIMVIRCDDDLDEQTKRKISMFCQVPVKNIIVNKSVSSIYEVPLHFDNQDIGGIICNKLQIPFKKTQTHLQMMNDFISFSSQDTPSISIAIVGKYTKLSDSYLSIINALTHAAFNNLCSINIEWVASEDINYQIIKECDGVIIPGGFGKRGIDGMLSISKYCRTENKPMLGICLGMHIMCIEAARELYGDSCNSEEFDPHTEHPIISIVNSTEENIGGTMKLGMHNTQLKQYNGILQTLAHRTYQKKVIHERHRHRYEVNPAYIDALSTKLFFSGTDEDQRCIDIVEVTNHPFYIGCQYHPEFLSSLSNPAPLFVEFIRASLKNKGGNKMGKQDGETKSKDLRI
tara:strand:- start:161 stop:1825 length:1665 start_codon:yes stop_codon:yes gene_type:complete